jgi:hypothetical protein
MEAIHERRSTSRVSFQGTVLAETGAKHLLCRGGDLSEGGMRLCRGPEGQVEPGQAITLRFKLPQLERWMVLKAVLLRREPVGRESAWGLHFLTPSPEDRRVLRTYVFTGQGKVTEFDPDA